MSRPRASCQGRLNIPLIYRNLSQRAMERLKEEIDLMGPKPRSEVNQAQEEVGTIARKLEEDGKINLGKGGGSLAELRE